MIKYIGILAVLLSALAISKEYSAFSKKRLSESCAFLSFLEHMKIQVGCFLRPANELLKDFSSDTLAAVGFTDALENSESLVTAYKTAEPKLSLSKEEREVLENLFSAVGECYLDEGVRLIDTAREKLEKLYQKNKIECPKNAKLVSVISVTAAIGFLMLVL